MSKLTNLDPAQSAGLLEVPAELRSREKIPVQVFRYPEFVNKVVADEIAALIRSKPDKCVLGFSTGSSPTGVFEELVRLHKEEGLSFKNVITFNLDEYYPMPATKLQSYNRFMREYLFDHVDIPAENINIPSGTVPEQEIEKYCEQYERKIKEVGGIDIQLFGIGGAGHVGFNEPGSAKTTKTRRVELDRMTRISAASDFFGVEHVPPQAITMGLSTVLAAKRVIIMAFSEGKARVIAKIAEAAPTDAVPASHFQGHPNVTVFVDEAAATELSRIKVPWALSGTLPLFTYTPILARKAVIWLSLLLKKPILKLVEEDYVDNQLTGLLLKYGPAPTLNLRVFRHMQGTITGWPGGRPSGVPQSPALSEASDLHWDQPLSEAKPDPKRIIVFSPHPDDDVISMGGTLIRLCDQGHHVHVAYQTSGNIAVWDEDAQRFANFATEMAKSFGIDASKMKAIEDSVEDFVAHKEPAQVDSKEVQKIKGLIRQTEARAAARNAGVHVDRIHFLELPFYETGAVKKKPLSEADVDIVAKFLERVKPQQIYAAGDLSDPHGTHRVCLRAVLAAVKRLGTQQWMQDCCIWLYRGAWQEWELERIEMAVPMSPHELMRKRLSIFKHQSQKDIPAFPGSDKREFWVRAEDRNRTTAQLYDKLGLTEFEGVEAFVRWHLGNKNGTNPI